MFTGILMWLMIIALWAIGVFLLWIGLVVLGVLCFMAFAIIGAIFGAVLEAVKWIKKKIS